MGKVKEIFEPLINAIRPMVDEAELQELEDTLGKIEDEKTLFTNDLKSFEELLENLDLKEIETEDDLWAALGGWAVSLAKDISNLAENGIMNKYRGTYYIEELRKLTSDPEKVGRLKLLITQIRGDTLKW